MLIKVLADELDGVIVRITNDNNVTGSVRSVLFRRADIDRLDT